MLTPVPRPSAASAPELELAMLRSAAVPVCSVILPAAIVAALPPVEPVILSIALRISCTVPVVLMVPPLAVVLVAAELLKVSVLPSTVSVSLLAKAAERSPVAVPESTVPVVIAAVDADEAAVWVTLEVVRPRAPRMAVAPAPVPKVKSPPDVVVARVIWPPEIVAVPVPVPELAESAVRMSPKVDAVPEPRPMVVVVPEVAVDVADALNVMVWLPTVNESPASAERSRSPLAVPSVAPLVAAAWVVASVSAEPISVPAAAVTAATVEVPAVEEAKVASVAAGPVPSRLSAVAPLMAAVVTLDLVE